jgi:hypothetical protein
LTERRTSAFCDFRFTDDFSEKRGTTTFIKDRSDKARIQQG